MTRIVPSYKRLLPEALSVMRTRNQYYPPSSLHTVGAYYAAIILARKVTSDLTVERREILPGDITTSIFADYMNIANSAVSAYDFEIRSTNHQITKTRTYSLINSASDPTTQLATTFSADEISFLKRVLDAMFETNNTPRAEICAITSQQALHLNKPDQNRRTTQGEEETQGSIGQAVTLTQAENVLKSLVGQGWFERSRKGYYSLSPRALMELRGWLIETYNDDDESDEDGARARPQRVKQCHACKEIVTVVRPVLPDLHYSPEDSLRDRVNAVPNEHVLAGYMISARKGSFACRSRPNAPFAGAIGQGMISWVSGLLQQVRRSAKPANLRRVLRSKRTAI